MNHEEMLYEVGFSMAKGMQGDTAEELLRRIGSPADFFSLSHRELVARACVESAIFSDAYRQELLDKAQKELCFMSANKIKALYWKYDDYPKRLEQCSDAPVVLYKLGDCDLNRKHIVSIVGTRHATPYGIDFTTRLVADLAKMLPDVIIVSGLAFGIDIKAHQAAMNAGVDTVAVVAHALNTIYPAEHRNEAIKILKKGGAIVSEYSQGYVVNRGSFLARNRIVAGVSDCVVVIESDIKGGSMSTARIARAYNREVMAVPGRINDPYSRGTNHLIANNIAQLITGAEDLIECMGWKSENLFTAPVKSDHKPLPPELKELYDYICVHPEATVNEMCVDLSLPFAKISDRLFQLEMDDRIIQMPGGRYAPVAK